MGTFMKKLEEITATELQEAWSSPWGLLWILANQSKDYWLICERKGQATDADLMAVYELMGSCHIGDFIDWWCRIGVDISGINEAKRIEVLTKMDQIGSTGLELDKWIYLKVPAHQDANALQRQFASVIAAHPQRTPEILAEHRQTTASKQFKLNDFKGIDYGVMRKAAEVWIEHQCYFSPQLKTRFANATDAPKTLWQLGEKLDVSPMHVTTEHDEHDVVLKKRKAMKLAVMRMLKRAEDLIANFEVGVFPSYAEVAKRQRWPADEARDARTLHVESLGWQKHLIGVRNEIRDIGNGGRLQKMLLQKLANR